MQDRAVIGVIQFFHDLLYLFSRFQIVGDPSLLLLFALYDLPQQPLGIFGGNRKFFDLLCQSCSRSSSSCILPTISRAR